MKKILCCLLLSILLLIGTRMESGVEVFSGGQIPASVWESMDGETRQALTEEPKYVALTFDDGPRRGTTDLLLDGLAKRGAVATFFVIGQQIPGNEALLQRMKEEGHQIGNHTYSHVKLLTAEKDIVIEEMQKCEVMLENVLGERVFWLRPPYGLIDTAQAALMDTPMIYWTLDPEDWKLLDASMVKAYVVEHVKPGDIILLHDFYPTSVEAALAIVDFLQERGYRFVTVEELFRIQKIVPQKGVLYASPSRIRDLR